MPERGKEYPFFVARKGEMVKCQLCQQSTTGLIVLRFYTPKGVKVCGKCYQAVESHCHQPYSQVMDRLAMAEAGYRANRKQARLREEAKGAR